MRGTIRQRRTRCNFCSPTGTRGVSANFIPRSDGGALVDQGPHDCVHDEPCREYDNEPDQYICEYLPRRAHIPAAACRDVFPPRPCEQYRGEEDRDKDARIEDVLRQRRDMTQIAINPAAGNYFCRHTSCGGGKEGGNKKNCGDQCGDKKHALTDFLHMLQNSCSDIRTRG